MHTYDVVAPRPSDLIRLVPVAFFALTLSCPALPCPADKKVELKMKSQLFYTAHQLVEAGPKQAVSWFAVACYYHLLDKNELAQRYFLKVGRGGGAHREHSKRAGVYDTLHTTRWTHLCRRRRPPSLLPCSCFVPEAGSVVVPKWHLRTSYKGFLREVGACPPEVM